VSTFRDDITSLMFERLSNIKELPSLTYGLVRQAMIELNESIDQWETGNGTSVSVLVKLSVSDVKFHELLFDLVVFQNGFVWNFIRSPGFTSEVKLEVKRQNKYDNAYLGVSQRNTDALIQEACKTEDKLVNLLAAGLKL
jgi:hypothetical protein